MKAQKQKHDDTGAVAGTVRRCAKLLESLEDELNKPSAGQATDDAGRSETEASDGDDVALDDTPPRHLPEGVVYLRAAFDDVIEALSAVRGPRPKLRPSPWRVDGVGAVASMLPRHRRESDGSQNTHRSRRRRHTAQENATGSRTRWSAWSGASRKATTTRRYSKARSRAARSPRRRAASSGP